MHASIRREGAAERSCQIQPSPAKASVRVVKLADSGPLKFPVVYQTNLPEGRVADTQQARFWPTFAVVTAGIAMVNLDLFVANVALPSIGRAFHGVSLAYLSWVLNAYAIIFAALLIPAGRAADRIGRRTSFLAGVVIFALASAWRALPLARGCSSSPGSSRRLAARCSCHRRSACCCRSPRRPGAPPRSGLDHRRRSGRRPRPGHRRSASAGHGAGCSSSTCPSPPSRSPRACGCCPAGGATASRDDQPRPDILGVALLTAAVGALALALVKAGAGAGRPPRLGSIAVAAVLACFSSARPPGMPRP